MNKRSVVLAGAIAALSVAGAANAATYTSQLEYRDGLVGPQPSYGVVKLEEIGADTVKVTVTLTDIDSLFVLTGQPFNHNPFVFNTNAVDSVSVSTNGFSYDGKGNPNATPAAHDTWNSTPFGLFTDRIGCCTQNGQTGGIAGPLVFTVSNNGGLTFAGSGNRFTSNGGGWWFAADIYDGATRQTYNVAARDAIRQGVPEPAGWALMIVGFFGVGAGVRRRAGVLA